jgi:hypothetical protein
VERPDTQYAWNGDVALAYMALGDGPTDLVYLQGWISNGELNWESPYLAKFLRGSLLSETVGAAPSPTVRHHEATAGSGREGR